jgi:glutathione S-transferase
VSYRLVNARPSPYGRKVAVALREKGLPYETLIDEPWGPASRTSEFSPLRQLPILLTPAGEAIYDSGFILDWLEITHPAAPLLPADSAARIAALRVRTLGERLMEIAQALIFETLRPQPSAAWIERQTDKVVGGLAALEKLLGEPPPSAEAPIHQGHIAVGTTLLVWEFVVADGISPDIAALRWRDRPATVRLVDVLQQRPSFAATRPASMPVDIAGQVG